MSLQSTSQFGSEKLDANGQDELIKNILALTAAVKTGHFDECRDLQDELRPHWKTFFQYLGQNGLEQLPESAETIARLIAQNGVTYNVFADNKGQPRPWSLNPLPLLITPPEWRFIAGSLAQRAKLLDLMLHDIYGEQTLIKAGYLPAALIFGHPGYLRGMKDVKPLGDIYLHVAAFDIARGPDGRWWVVRQRTQSPSGLGYTLENRLITSGLFPEAYREMRIQHVASSYKRLLHSIRTAASAIAGGGARLALLTSGPSSDTYFEHAYLARYLGLALVEGADLTVRDDKLYLKTMHGLQRIHGLLRRIDDEYCDPLELKADSTLGVPGLLQAVRAGNVVMANALGTRFVESPAVQGFLPSISEYLLGEPLKMPSLHTWWCGERAAWKDISQDLHTQVVKPTFGTNGREGFPPVIASLLDTPELQHLRDRIDLDPDRYTTQSYLPFSQAPTWSGQELTPRTAMLRVYLIADGNGGWEALPGGMTRIAAVDPHVVSIQSGGSTLDTWVMTDQSVDDYSMLPSRVKLPRWTESNQLVSSRSAENLFWLGRYTERCESMVRLAKEALVLMSTDQQNSLPVLNDTVSDLLEQHGMIPPVSPDLTRSAALLGKTLIRGLTLRGNNGLTDHIDLLEFTLKAARDRLPAEHAEIAHAMKKILGIDLMVPRAEGSLKNNTRAQARKAISLANRPAIDTIELLDAVGVQLAALVGFQSDRMTRDLGWHMLTAGRLVERMIILTTTIKAFFKHSAVYTPRGFDSLLTLFDSSITYRGRYQRQQDTLALIDLIVHDQTNPRALVCILDQLVAEIAHIPHAESILSTIPTIDSSEDEVLKIVQSVEGLGLFALQLSDSISHRFFAHAVDRHFVS